MGVELGELNDELETHAYPVSKDDLVEEHGEYELNLPRGSGTFGDVLEPVDDQTYESPEEVRQMIYPLVADEAVGREDYSDRGPAADQTGDESDERTL